MLLTYTGSKCFMNKHKSKLSPMKRKRLSKEPSNKEDDIKNLKKSHQHWNDWKFQIHWNKLEWVVPKSCKVRKTPFCKYPHNFYIEYKTTTNHWVGHSLMKPIDVDELFNRRLIISESESSLNDDDAIDASGSTDI